LTSRQNCCNINNIKREFEYHNFVLKIKEHTMSGSDGKLEGTFWIVIALIMVVVLIAVQACSLFYESSESAGKQAGMAAKEVDVSEDATADGAAKAHLPRGDAQYASVSELDISVANGTAECIAGDLPEGSVELEWVYHDGKGGKPAEDGYELRHDLRGGELVIKDWRDQSLRWLKDNTVKIDLTLKYGPGVVISDANVGNGTFCGEGEFGGDINVGNGSVNLDGELVSGADINVGNGSLEGELLIAGGNHNINVGNGSIELKLHQDSDVAVSATVAVGGIDAPPEIKVSRAHLVGSSAAGSIGSGAASLDVTIGNGSLEIAHRNAPTDEALRTRKSGVGIWKPDTRLVLGLIGTAALLSQINV
jgi:hypothetical protein